MSASALLLGFALSAGRAEAGGLYYSDRGVRPLGRAGAFVAGADDLGAIAYNPAGLYDAGSQILFDASWVNFSSEYTRQALLRQVDPNTGKQVGSATETFASVHGTTPFLPIPTAAISFQPHKQVVVAFGAWAPYAALTEYPSEVSGKPAPQRYSLVNLNGSALAFVGAAAAFAPSKQWRLGAELGMMTGTFDSVVNFSGCIPDRFICAPESPDYDVAGQLKVGPIFAPTGEVGAIFIPDPGWHLGLAFQLPVYVRAGGTISTRMPSAPLFERASQNGSAVGVAFDLPWILRAGIENRLVKNLRVELGGELQHWSMHEAITVTPNHISLDNVVGLPPKYYLNPITLPRHFQDCGSVRLGGEYSLDVKGRQLDLRGGVSFETSAIPTNYLSVLTIDQNKLTTSLGAGFHYSEKLRFDAVFSHVFGFDVTVDPAKAAIAQTVPVKANPSPHPDMINGGHYSAGANVLGLGFAYTFDAPPPEFQPVPPPPKDPPPP